MFSLHTLRKLFYLLSLVSLWNTVFVVSAQNRLLEARDDYPTDRTFTINSDRYYLGSGNDGRGSRFFGNTKANRVIILRAMVPYRGNFAVNETKFSQVIEPIGYGVFLKHRTSQFMLGLEKLTADYAVETDTDHPEVDKITFDVKNLYLHYVFELGDFIITETNFSVGFSYGNGEVRCNSTSCRNAYPDYKSVKSTFTGYNFHLGVHVWFLELNLGMSFLQQQTFELRSVAGDKTFKFEAGREIYYYGLSVRI